MKNKLARNSILVMLVITATVVLIKLSPGLKNQNRFQSVTTNVETAPAKTAPTVLTKNLARPEAISETDKALAQFGLSTKNLVGLRPVAQVVPPIRISNNLQKKQ